MEDWKQICAEDQGSPSAETLRAYLEQTAKRVARHIFARLHQVMWRRFMR